MWAGHPPCDCRPSQLLSRAAVEMTTTFVGCHRIVPITVLEARSLKSGCQRGQAPSGGSRGGAHCLIQFLAVATIPGLGQHRSNVCLRLHRAFFPCLCLESASPFS